MTKEFLKDVVEKRERSGSVSRIVRQQYEEMTRSAYSTYAPDTRVYDASTAATASPTSRYFHPFIRGTEVISGVGNDERNLHQPPHIIRIMPRARTITANLIPRAIDNNVAVIEFHFADERRSYTRTNTTIGNVDTSMLFEAQPMLTRHAYSLVEQHGCYPDYNVSSYTTDASSGRVTAINYTCAQCSQRFTGMD